MKCPKCGKEMDKKGAMEICRTCGSASFTEISGGGHISVARCVYIKEKKQDKKQDKKKSVCEKSAIRWFALVVIALCALTVALCPYYVIKADGVALASNGITLTAALFKSTGRMFGFVPAFAVKGTLGMVYNVAIYVFLLCTALAAILSVIALFSKKNAPRRIRRALFFLGVGALFYSVMFILTTRSVYPDLKMSANSLLAWLPFVLDTFSFVLGVVCLLLSLLLLIFRRKNK